MLALQLYAMFARQHHTKMLRGGHSAIDVKETQQQPVQEHQLSYNVFLSARLANMEILHLLEVQYWGL